MKKDIDYLNEVKSKKPKQLYKSGNKRKYQHKQTGINNSDPSIKLNKKTDSDLSLENSLLDVAHEPDSHSNTEHLIDLNATTSFCHQGSSLYNPNELVTRLNLLVSSQNAGNTGVNNEIISILEELRERKLIV